MNTSTPRPPAPRAGQHDPRPAGHPLPYRTPAPDRGSPAPSTAVRLLLLLTAVVARDDDRQLHRHRSLAGRRTAHHPPGPRAGHLAPVHRRAAAPGRAHRGARGARGAVPARRHRGGATARPEGPGRRQPRAHAGRRRGREQAAGPGLPRRRRPPPAAVVPVPSLHRRQGRLGRHRLRRLQPRPRQSRPGHDHRRAQGRSGRVRLGARASGRSCAGARRRRGGLGLGARPADQPRLRPAAGLPGGRRARARPGARPGPRAGLCPGTGPGVRR